MIYKTPTTINADDTHSEYKDIFNKRYYILNKRLLYAAGLWPGQPFKQKAVRTGVPIIASLIIMASQGSNTRALTSTDIKSYPLHLGEGNSLAECMAPIGMNIAGILKLSSGLVHAHEVRKLFDAMQKDWEDVRHLPEINFLKKCGEKGRFSTIFYFIFVYGVVGGWVVMSFSPKIMDTLAPLNYSRRRFDLLPADFIVDQDEYFYPILIFITLTLLYQILVHVAIDTLYMTLGQHQCAMFELLRYNLHNVLQDYKSTDVNLTPDIHEDTKYHKLISCIKKHKIIIDFIKSMKSTCEWKLLAVVGLNMLGLSFTGYMAIVTSHDNTTVDPLRYIFFSIALVFHLYCNTLPSHWINDASSTVPIAAYNCRWYMMSLRSRKLVLFLIRASIEPCNITAGKIYVMSVENFSSVLRTSMSYLAMLNSLQ